MRCLAQPRKARFLLRRRLRPAFRSGTVVRPAGDSQLGRLRLTGLALGPVDTSPHASLDSAESARRQSALIARLEKVRRQSQFVAIPLPQVPVRPAQRCLPSLQRSVPVDAVGPAGFRVMGCLSVGWPYTAAACTSTNAFVLNKVRELVTEAEAANWTDADEAEGAAASSHATLVEAESDQQLGRQQDSGSRSSLLQPPAPPHLSPHLPTTPQMEASMHWNASSSPVVSRH